MCKGSLQLQRSNPRWETVGNDIRYKFSSPSSILFIVEVETISSHLMKDFVNLTVTIHKGKTKSVRGAFG